MVLDEGKVVDVGAHAELLARCPLYVDLFKGQWVDSDVR